MRRMRSCTSVGLRRCTVRLSVFETVLGATPAARATSSIDTGFLCSIRDVGVLGSKRLDRGLSKADFTIGILVPQSQLVGPLARSPHDQIQANPRYWSRNLVGLPTMFAYTSAHACKSSIRAY